jgi:hypothetical protein
VTQEPDPRDGYRQERRLQKERRRRKRYVRQRNIDRERRKSLRSRSKKSRITIPAPTNFSFIDNPEELIDYVESARSICREGKRVYFDLADVENLTVDAVTVLLAVLQTSPIRRTLYGGNLPLKTEFRDTLAYSGFLDHVGYAGKRPVKQAIMLKRQHKKVHGTVAQEMRRFATTRTLGRDEPYRAIQESAVDCMANAQEHAIPGSEGSISWFFSVYFDTVTKVTKFSFVDCGVGILKSITMRDRTRFEALIDSSKSAHGLLRSIFEGKIGSRTGQPNRGRGLPKIWRYFSKNEIRRLIVITNGAYVNFDQPSRSRTLPVQFDGTFIYWELWPESNG